MKKREREIRVGVLGAGRGQVFINEAGEIAGMKLVAVCDVSQKKLDGLQKLPGVSLYSDYGLFLKHEMDAVILANYFAEHAPFALKALDAGKHVMSECTCNATLAEGVALCRKVEETGLVYMLAENYPYTAFNMEMRRIYQTGEIGEVAYAEGEYNHPVSDEEGVKLSPGWLHWRNWLPPTYYCTHALAPLMFITDAMPTKVNALSIAFPKLQRPAKNSDPAAVTLVRMDNGSVFRLLGIGLPGHSNWYRLHGSKGAMESVRGHGYFGPGQIRIWHEPWAVEKGLPVERTYVPAWPTHAELAGKAGHGGGDFWTCFEFANAIREGKAPFLDVYRGVAMSSVGILAWKSALADGSPFEMPDFRDEKSRVKVENDDDSPFPFPVKPGRKQMPPSILGMPKPNRIWLEKARRIWKDAGCDPGPYPESMASLPSQKKSLRT